MKSGSKWIAIVLGVGLAACGVGKELDEGLDYGPEDAALSAKDDSATNPASMGRLTLGTPLKTTFTTTKRWRAFKFAATAGVKHDIFVDGLRDLDTVAYVYNVSATTGRPYSRAIARNDDTESPGWTVGSNTTVNPQSSSIVGFVPRYSRDYAVVVTTYQQASRGTASVVVRRVQPTASAFVAGPTGRFATLEGVRFEAMNLTQSIKDLNAATPSAWSTLIAAYRASPAALRGAMAAGDAVIDAVVAHAFGREESSWSFYIAPMSPQQAGTNLADRLAFHAGSGMSDAELATVRANYARLSAAMNGDGATHGFTARMEESGDWSYVAVVVVNVETGEVRAMGFYRDA